MKWLTNCPDSEFRSLTVTVTDGGDNTIVYDLDEDFNLIGDDGGALPEGINFSGSFDLVANPNDPDSQVLAGLSQVPGGTEKVTVTLSADYLACTCEDYVLEIEPIPQAGLTLDLIVIDLPEDAPEPPEGKDLYAKQLTVSEILGVDATGVVAVENLAPYEYVDHVTDTGGYDTVENEWVIGDLAANASVDMILYLCLPAGTVPPENVISVGADNAPTVTESVTPPPPPIDILIVDANGEPIEDCEGEHTVSFGCYSDEEFTGTLEEIAAALSAIDGVTAVVNGCGFTLTEYGECTDDIVVLAPDVSVNKTTTTVEGEPLEKYVVGTNWNYEIETCNNGTATAIGATLTDVLPEGVTIVTAPEGWADGVLALGDIPAGECVTTILTVVVNEELDIINTATVSGENFPEVEGPNFITAVPCIQPNCFFTADNQADGGTVDKTNNGLQTNLAPPMLGGIDVINGWDTAWIGANLRNGVSIRLVQLELLGCDSICTFPEAKFFTIVNFQDTQILDAMNAAHVSANSGIVTTQGINPYVGSLDGSKGHYFTETVNCDSCVTGYRVRFEAEGYLAEDGSPAYVEFLFKKHGPIEMCALPPDLPKGEIGCPARAEGWQVDPVSGSITWTGQGICQNPVNCPFGSPMNAIFTDGGTEVAALLVTVSKDACDGGWTVDPTLIPTTYDTIEFECRKA